MALYSWFSHHNNKPNIYTVKAKNKVLPTSESTRNIENYTMWPTAQIKQNIEVTFPINDTFNANKTKPTINSQLLSFKVPLLINK